MATKHSGKQAEIDPAAFAEARKDGLWPVCVTFYDQDLNPTLRLTLYVDATPRQGERIDLDDEVYEVRNVLHKVTQHPDVSFKGTVVHVIAQRVEKAQE